MAPQDTTCAVCREAASQKYGKCKSIIYCTAKCQKQDWSDHKLLCKQMRNMAPRPNARHIRPLYFPAIESKPCLLWVRGQPPGSKCEHLEEVDVRNLVSKEFKASKIARLGPTPKNMIVHHRTGPGHQTNVSLAAWIEEQRLEHIAPGPLLVSGHRGPGTEGDVHCDFEMKDLLFLRWYLEAPIEQDTLEFITNGGKDTTQLYRM